MTRSTRNIVFEGMEILPEALTPFVEKRLGNALRGHWQAEVAEKVRLKPSRDGIIAWDQAGLLNAMNRYWGEAFGSVLGWAERAIINELAEVRNRLAHNVAFSHDDAERALDSMRRLTEAIGADDAAEKLGRMRDSILRAKFAALPEDTSDARLSPDVPHPQQEAITGNRPVYQCPIPGCTKVFVGSRGGWDGHVGSPRMHPGWLPEITEPEERRRAFRKEFGDWFR